MSLKVLFWTFIQIFFTRIWEMSAMNMAKDFIQTTLSLKTDKKKISL